MTNISEFCANHKNLPPIPRDGKVCVETQDKVKDVLYSYIHHFKDYAYVGVIETDKLMVEEEEVPRDIYQLL